jgi:large subunit ribosomal protein L21
MFAIVEAGGRQEKVQPGAVVIVDRLEAEPGAEITFDKVLLVGNEDGSFVAGTPYVAGASVTGCRRSPEEGQEDRRLQDEATQGLQAHAGPPDTADARSGQEH